MKNRIGLTGTAIERTRGDLSYVPYGTIGWVKTKDNEVRQCKLVGAKWVQDRDCTPLYPVYEWRVAGIKEHQFGFGKADTIPIGFISKTEHDAQIRAYSSGGTMNGDGYVDVIPFLKDKYGMQRCCFKFGGGALNENLEVMAYENYPDGSVRLTKVDLDIEVTEKGFDITIPSIEGTDKKRRTYPTREKAIAARRPLKTYTFDDEDGAEVQRESEKVSITIEIKKDDIEKLKEIAKIKEIK